MSSIQKLDGKILVQSSESEKSLVVLPRSRYLEAVSENQNYPYGDCMIKMRMDYRWDRQHPDISDGLPDSFGTPVLSLEDAATVDFFQVTRHGTPRVWLFWPEFSLAKPCLWDVRSSFNLVELVDLVVNWKPVPKEGAYSEIPEEFGFDEHVPYILSLIKESLMAELKEVYDYYAYCIEKYRLSDAGITKMKATYVSDAGWEVLKRDFPVLFDKGRVWGSSRPYCPIEAIEETRAEVASGLTIAWAI